MGQFLFNQDSNIVMYGAAAIGNIMYDNLTGQGFRIKGFIDKRAYEISEFRGVPVWQIDDKRLSMAERESMVIIVSVKNVFEHEQIVMKLLNCGYKKIIYKSKSVLNNCATDDRIALSDLYDAILANEHINNQQLFETESAIIHDYKDSAIISDDGDYVITHLPMEFVYTNNYLKDESKWGNVNILSFFTHLGFFRFLAGENGESYEDYINEYCIYTAPESVEITDGWKMNVVRNRAMIFEQMNLASELDADFFVRNAPEAVWNEKGYFNLTSGKHRACFFAAKDYKYMPVKISKADYDSFLNIKKADALNEYLQKSGCSVLALPVSHPYFYNYPCLSNEYYRKFISYFSGMIAREIYFPEKYLHWNTVSVAEVSDSPYGLINHFSRMGSKAYRIGKPAAETELFNDVLHTHNITALSPDETAYPEIDYLLVEADDTEKLQTIISKLHPKRCIVTCNEAEMIDIKGYKMKAPAFRTYKGEKFVSVVCFEEDR